MGLPDIYYEPAPSHVPQDRVVAQAIAACDTPTPKTEDDCASAGVILRAEDPREATARFIEDWRLAVGKVKRTGCDCGEASDAPGGPIVDLSGSGISGEGAAIAVAVAAPVLIAAAVAGNSAPSSTIRAGDVERVRRIQHVALRSLFASRPDDPYCKAMTAELEHWFDQDPLNPKSVDAFERAHHAATTP